jgi:hypothetical protein
VDLRHRVDLGGVLGLPSSAVYLVKIAYEETTLREKLKIAGAR